MNSATNWVLRIDPNVFKLLKRLPRHDTEAILSAINFLATDPFSGDVKKLKGEDDVWRKRIGAYRIFYKIYTAEKSVLVFDAERRSSNTY